MFTSAKNFGISVGLLALASLSSIHSAEAAATSIHGAPTFFDIEPQTAPAHNPAELNSLFTRGVGPFTPAMEGQIYPYPLTKGGVFGADQYNGCYDRKNRRLGDLGPGNTCGNAISANPGIAVYRLFMGYKISCPGTINGAGNCTDAQLVMNCALEQVQAGDGPFDNSAVTTRNCSNEKGITRHALGSSNAAPAFPGCYPGQDGSTYPTCDSCDYGKYNSMVGANTVACTSCNGTASVANSDLANPPTFTTDNKGSIDVAQCRVTGALKCAPGYSPSADGQTCNAAASACNLKIALIPKHPGTGASDGEITATYSGETGGVSGPVITSPNAKSPTSTAPAIFTGLNAGTYTVSVSDTTCTQSTQITLVDAVPTPSCSSCPALSTISSSGTSCERLPSTTSASSSTWTYSCQGAGSCTAAAPCKKTCTTSSTIPDATVPGTVCNGSPYQSNLSGACTQDTAVSPNPTVGSTSLSCPNGFSLSAGKCSIACTNGPTPSPTPCTLALNMNPGVNPTTIGSTTGSISGNISGVTGSLSVVVGSVQPVPPSNPTVSGGTATMSATNLAAGYYSVTVTETRTSGGNCTVNSGTILTPPAAPTCTLALNTTGITNPTTAAGSDGSFTVNASGYSTPMTLTFLNPPPGYSGATTVTVPANGTMAPKTFTGLPVGNWSVAATDPICTQNASANTVAPPACALGLTLAETASWDATGGKIIATTSGVTGTATLDISPKPVPYTIVKTAGPGANDTTYTNLDVAASGQTIYTVTATDSACTKTATTYLLRYNICQSLTCPSGGALTYFNNSGDIVGFVANGGKTNATNYQGQTTTTCSWGKNNKTTWGSPYVVCGGSAPTGNGSCMTHTSNQLVGIGEATYSVSKAVVQAQGLAAACAVSGW